MQEKIQECAEFFRAHPAYHRILEQFLKKYRSFGRPAGTICLTDATVEECDAVRALFGRSFSSPLRIKTTDFEAALQETPYRGVVLKELLECYFGLAIQTKYELSTQMDAHILQIVEQTKADIKSPICRQWLDNLSDSHGEGGRLLRKNLSKNGDIVQRAILQACQGIDWLEAHPGEQIRLAVLSANATSDPHALDGNTLCGKLFMHLLSVGTNRSFPICAEERDALYYEYGILCDSISSSITQVGVRLYTGEGEHPAYAVFRHRKEPNTLTLRNLAVLTAADSPSGKAYLVENQMVFSQLCDRASLFHSPLICTSGQPTVAVFRLLDMLTNAGTELFYSGDFDGKGLSIAAHLFKRYPKHLHFWHMSAEDYRLCRSDIALSKDSLTLLKSCANTPLAFTAEAIQRNGCDGYQELLLSALQADLIET